jgi:cytochrome c
MRLLALWILTLPILPGAGWTQHSTSSGIYTREQSERGEVLYARACASCHGPSLQGGAQASPLIGSGFSASWEGRRLVELFELMRLSMPGDDPGSLTLQQNVDLLAYVLRANKFPAGVIALPADRTRLEQITFSTKR